jgi:hypothetical protein
MSNARLVYTSTTGQESLVEPIALQGEAVQYFTVHPEEEQA